MCLVPTCLAWQLEEIGTHEFGCASWLWFVSACVAVAVGRGSAPTRVAVTVGCDWVPKCVVTAVECVGCPRVWPWQLDVIVTHEVGGASWMWFVPPFVAVAAGCGWRAPISR